MPELIVQIVRIRMEMKPHEENMIGEEADCKQNYKGQDHFHHFSPSSTLWLDINLLTEQKNSY